MSCRNAEGVNDSSGLPQCGISAYRDEAYSMIFDRPRKDCLRLAIRRLGVIEGAEHGGDIVAIDDFCRPAFRVEFLALNFCVVPVHCRFALAQRIDLSQNREVVKFVMCGERCRLPHLALSHFAVTQQHVDTRWTLIHTRAELPAPNRQIIPTCRGVDTGNTRCRMAF